MLRHWPLMQERVTLPWKLLQSLLVMHDELQLIGVGAGVVDGVGVGVDEGEGVGVCVTGGVGVCVSWQVDVPVAGADEPHTLAAVTVHVYVFPGAEVNVVEVPPVLPSTRVVFVPTSTTL